MNLNAVLEALDRIDGNSWIARRFLNDTAIPDHMVALEVFGRMNAIEARVAQIRAEIARDPDPSGRGGTNVHVIGDRPSSTRSPEAA